MTKVEAIARALCVRRGEFPDRRIQEYGRTSHSYPAWEDFREEAVVALKAMKGPTEEMHIAADKANADRGELDMGWTEQAIIFNAMIQAILDEKP